jgi:uncharacterized RDD family membrane protein YckC
MPYVGFWRRVLAYIIDAIILFLGFWFIDLVSGGAVFQTLETGGGKSDLPVSFAFEMTGFGTLLSFVASWLYFAGFEASTLQATPGKMTVGAKVTDLEGAKIGFPRATGRYFSKILSGIILLIGFIMVGLTARKQGLHDKIAETLVIKRYYVPSAAGHPSPPPPPPAGR